MRTLRAEPTQLRFRDVYGALLYTAGLSISVPLRGGEGRAVAQERSPSGPLYTPTNGASSSCFTNALRSSDVPSHQSSSRRKIAPPERWR